MAPSADLATALCCSLLGTPSDVAGPRAGATCSKPNPSEKPCLHLRSAAQAEEGLWPTPGTEAFTADHVVHLCALGATCSQPTQ